MDNDFGNLIRDDVIDYCREKYGTECVSGIVTFSTLSAKAVCKDVARIMFSQEEDKKLGDMISKTIPKKPKITLKKCFEESPEFINLYKTNSKAKQVIDNALRLEGLPKACGQHACFDKDTMVTTDKGLKAISEITIGDLVLTHNNRFMPVTETMITDTDEVYALKTSCSLPVEVTANHPMLVREMTVDGWRKTRKWSTPKWKEVSELNIGTDYIGIAINQESIIPEYKNLSLPFDNENFWWVIGRYIGDGWTECLKRTEGNAKWNEERVVICCSKKNNAELDEIVKYLSNASLDYRYEEAYTTYKIYIKNKDLYVYLQQFGKYAHGKSLTSDILNLPIELTKSFIEGYVSADGCINKNTGRYQIKTVSKKLAIGISMLINKAYKRFANINVIERGQEVIQGRTVNAKTAYQIFFTKNKRTREKSFYENGYIWTRVSDLTVKEESKKMYNLTVAEDSSYTVHGLIAHNCGIIISDQAIKNYCPQVFIKDKKTGVVTAVTQYTMGECEEIGLLKVDFLGLKTMTVLKENVDDVNSIYGMDLKITTIPINDPLTYLNIYKGKTAGVFQLESNGMTSFMTKLFQDVPSKLAHIDKDKKLSKEEKEKAYSDLGNILFERLIAGISLYRPGPMDEIPRYIDGMLNPTHILYDTPELQDILNVTYGVIVYQEQVMTTVRNLAGFNRGQADTIRKSMGKKLTEILDEYKEYFIYGSGDKIDAKTGKLIGIKGCINSGIEEKKAIIIWDKMYEFSRYAFNKSHKILHLIVINTI